MKNIPQSIWLNIGDECPNDVDFRDLSEVSWSEERVFDNDIQYHRQSEWISVEDALPEDDRLVIVHIDDLAYPSEISNCMAYFKNGTWCFPDDYYYDCNVTHWMRIPKLPKTDKQ